MVLCLVDDLIFSIKISTAAKALAAPVFFERSPDMALPRIREKQPSLVIFDLNSAKLRPLEIIAQMKADPALKDDPDARLCLTRSDRRDCRGARGGH